jgi:hypothetical protein
VTSAGGEMKLLNVSERVKDLLQITRLCAVFETHEDEVTAIRSFSVPPIVAQCETRSEFFLG